jgi:hypothetical protein
MASGERRDTILDMPSASRHLGSLLLVHHYPGRETCEDEHVVCAWDAMRAVYEAQAARGVPEAIRGLERIREDRWPTSGTARRP